MRTLLAKNRRDAETSADLVVRRGIVIKNRYGLMGSSVIVLPDGCYELTRIEPPIRRGAKKLTKR